MTVSISDEAGGGGGGGGSSRGGGGTEGGAGGDCEESAIELVEDADLSSSEEGCNSW